MNWRKILSNFGGMVIGGIAAVTAVTGVPTSGTGWKAFGLAVLLAVLGNQIGLHQDKPAQ